MKSLKKMGRKGDTEIGHLTPGEIVVPVGVLKKNPQLKKIVLAAIKKEGMDPGRYIVGGKDDSVNPKTGAREYFDNNSDEGMDDAFSDAAEESGFNDDSDEGVSLSLDDVSEDISIAGIPSGADVDSNSDPYSRDELDSRPELDVGETIDDAFTAARKRRERKKSSLLDSISSPFELPTKSRAGFLKLAPGLGTLLTAGEIISALGGKPAPDRSRPGDSRRRAAFMTNKNEEKPDGQGTLKPKTKKRFARSGASSKSSRSGRLSTLLSGRGGTLG